MLKVIGPYGDSRPADDLDYLKLEVAAMQMSHGKPYIVTTPEGSPVCGFHNGTDRPVELIAMKWRHEDVELGHG